MSDDAKQFRWQAVDFEEAVCFMQGKILVEPPVEFGWPDTNRGGLPAKAAFADGTIVLAFSDWTGPWSSTTPDMSADPPEFWIGEPAGEG